MITLLQKKKNTTRIKLCKDSFPMFKNQNKIRIWDDNYKTDCGL